jgi:hypothetical protein
MFFGAFLLRPHQEEIKNRENEDERQKSLYSSWLSTSLGQQQPFKHQIVHFLFFPSV